MGVRILSDRENDRACLFCSTSEWAFGPTFGDAFGRDAEERAEAFLRWLPTNISQFDMHPLASGRDARSLTDAGLERAYAAWCAQEESQWGREDNCEHADPCTPRTNDICEPCEASFAAQREKAGAR